MLEQPSEPLPCIVNPKLFNQLQVVLTTEVEGTVADVERKVGIAHVHKFSKVGRILRLRPISLRHLAVMVIPLLYSVGIGITIDG